MEQLDVVAAGMAGPPNFRVTIGSVSGVNPFSEGWSKRSENVREKGKTKGAWTRVCLMVGQYLRQESVPRVGSHRRPGRGIGREKPGYGVGGDWSLGGPPEAGGDRQWKIL